MRYAKAGALLGSALVGLSGWFAAPGLAQDQTITVQQAFDAATKLDDSGDHAGALVAWQALEHRPGVSKHGLALVRLRESRTLFVLGRRDEAADMARAALRDLPGNDAAIADDRYLAYFSIGQAAETALDYASAADAYRHAEPLATTPEARLAVLRGQLSTDTFIDPEAAAQDSTRIEQVLAATPTLDAKSRAVIKSAQSVQLLNRGDFAAARKPADESVKLLGGLTSRTDLYDVAARSDYSIASLLMGDTDSARQYMAMTGAGRLPDKDFDPGVKMIPPPCDGDVQLKPQDAAVVQFSIGDDGQVTDVSPIYAAGGGAAAMAFAHAVGDWSWTPEQVKAWPVFFRNRVRVEMRCSTAFKQSSVANYLNDKLSAWLSDKGVDPAPSIPGSDAAALPILRQRLATTETAQGPNALALLPLLHALYASAVVDREASYAYAQRALAIADANGVPPGPRLGLADAVWALSAARHSQRESVAALEAAQVDPRYAGDPQARAAIHVALADTLRRNAPDRARTELQNVVDDKSADAVPALRTAALVRLASLDLRQGDAAAARLAYEKTGLSANQCALVDSAPQLKFSAGTNTFPMEAWAWGFEGWTQVQYDIAADGKVMSPRAVISYPPFVFTKAGQQTIGSMRYQPTYRPGGDLGCGGNMQRVRFLLPHRG